MGTLNNPVCEEERNVLSAKKDCLFPSLEQAVLFWFIFLVQHYWSFMLVQTASQQS